MFHVMSCNNSLNRYEEALFVHLVAIGINLNHIQADARNRQLVNGKERQSLETSRSPYSHRYLII